MSSSEFPFLRRFFLQGRRQPDRPSVSATEARQADARLAVRQFAREAVLALRQFEQTFDDSDPDAERQIGQRFGLLWDEAGLGGRDWSADDRDDAEKLLAAMAELANDPGRTATLREATEEVQVRGLLLETADDMQADLDRAYGATFRAPDPATWMQQSLGRLAKARVIEEDLAGLGTKVRPKQELVQSVADVLEQARRLADTRRGVDGALRAEQKAAKAANDADGRADRLAYEALGGTALVVAAVSPAVPEVFKGPVAGAGAALMVWRMSRMGRNALQIVDAREQVDRSRQQVTVAQQSLAGQREKLAGTLDQAALPAARRGNWQLPGGRRSSGGDRPR